MATKEEILTQIQPGKVITVKLLTDITNLAANAQTSADTATLQTKVNELSESITEISDSASKVPFSNLKVFMKQLRQTTNGATIVKNEDGSRVLTSTTTYGQEHFHMEWGKSKPTKALLIGKAKLSEGNNRITTYSYNGGINLGENQLWSLSKKVDGYDYAMSLCSIPSEANIFAPSPVLLSKSGVTAEYTDNDFVILDGSNMTNDDCAELFKQLIGTESGIKILTNIEKWKEFPLIYKSAQSALTAQTAVTAQTAQNAQTAVTAQTAQNAQTAVIAQNAQTAVTAQTAQNAQTAVTAQTAQIKENEIAVEYSEWRRENGPLEKQEDGSYLYQPTANYGAIKITPTVPFKVGKKYLIVWNRKNLVSPDPNNPYQRGAFLTAGKWDYAEDTPQYIDNKNGNFAYSILTTPSTPTTDLTNCYIIAGYSFYQTSEYRFMPYGVYELDLDFDVTKESVEEIISGGIVIYNTIQNHEERILDLENESAQGSWKGKKVLVIGDSITAAKQWQNQLHNILGMEVSTHAKGGIGMIAMVDGDKGLGGDYDNVTDASGTIYPLNTTDVGDKDLIIFLGGYNNRSLLAGSFGDVYPTNNTFSGQLQYCINRIYEELTKANNLTCRVMVGTMHCFGKYPYVDADGYTEYPTGSGQTAKTLCDRITEVAHGNNVAVCDLYNESGIGKFTWKVFGASPEAYIENPSNTATPYPHNGDQLHCSPLGYKRIGECMCGAVIKAFGN